MKQEQFKDVFDQTIKEIEQLLIVKGGEYAGSEDRLANFKRGAQRVGALPDQVLWIYLSKHLDSIETYIKDKVAGTSRPRSEPITGRIDDAINYLILYKAMVIESEGAQRGA